jgi:hypothetical protein
MAVGVMLVLAGAPSLAEAQQPSGIFSGLTGRVEVLAKGQTVWQMARLGMRIFEGDQVRAFAGANGELRLPDGSTIFVAENTRFVVTKLDYTPQNQMRSAFFHLAVGKIRGIVARAAVALVAARQSNFAVSTPTAVAAVRGTTVYAIFDPTTRQTTFMVADGTAMIRDVVTGLMVTVTAPPGRPQIVTQPAGQPFSVPRTATLAEQAAISSATQAIDPGAAGVLVQPTVAVISGDTITAWVGPPVEIPVFFIQEPPKPNPAQELSP